MKKPKVAFHLKLLVEDSPASRQITLLWHESSFFSIKALYYVALDGSFLIIGGIFYRICIRETQLTKMCEVFSFHRWRRQFLLFFKSVTCEWASFVEGLAT